jgi:cell fate regulator YaaT (PSP1 superfamily)
MSIILTGVRFQRSGRVHYCDAGHLDVKLNDQVIVETNRGLDVGRVVIAPQQVIYDEIDQPIDSILRHATHEDLADGENTGQ